VAARCAFLEANSSPLDVVRGLTEEISDGRSDDVDPGEAAESILDATDSLLTAVEKARLVQRLLDTGTTTDRVALSSLLAEETAETSEAAARPVGTDTDLPEACHVRSNEAVLGMAVGELLDDAIQHADGSELRVELSLTARETVTIRVADNGPGIPEQDREAVLSGTETDLEHSSRISL